jgi:hypothetical protein
MLEGFVTLWAILLLLLPGLFGGGAKQRNREIKKTLVAASPSPSPSTPFVVPSAPPSEQNKKSQEPASAPSSENPKKIPTPALLPGLIVFFGKVLQKKVEEKV